MISLDGDQEWNCLGHEWLFRLLHLQSRSDKVLASCSVSLQCTGGQPPDPRDIFEPEKKQIVGWRGVTTREQR